MLAFFSSKFQRRLRRFMVPTSVADRRADHDLENLIFGESRCLRGPDVLVADLVGLLCNLIN